MTDNDNRTFGRRLSHDIQYVADHRFPAYRM
jgi:hypothetical protein